MNSSLLDSFSMLNDTCLELAHNVFKPMNFFRFLFLYFVLLWVMHRHFGGCSVDHLILMRHPSLCQVMLQCTFRLIVVNDLHLVLSQVQMSSGCLILLVSHYFNRVQATRHVLMQLHLLLRALCNVHRLLCFLGSAHNLQA